MKQRIFHCLLNKKNVRMSNYHWPHSQNFFLPYLNKGYQTAFDIINDVDTKLKNGITDPEIAVIYNIFH